MIYIYYGLSCSVCSVNTHWYLLNKECHSVTIYAIYIYMCVCINIRLFLRLRIFAVISHGCLVISIVHRERKITLFSQNLFWGFISAKSSQITFCVSRNNSLPILFTRILAVKASQRGPQTARTAS